MSRVISGRHLTVIMNHESGEEGPATQDIRDVACGASVVSMTAWMVDNSLSSSSRRNIHSHPSKNDMSPTLVDGCLRRESRSDKPRQQESPEVEHYSVRQQWIVQLRSLRGECVYGYKKPQDYRLSLTPVINDPYLAFVETGSGGWVPGSHHLGHSHQQDHPSSLDDKNNFMDDEQFDSDAPERTTPMDYSFWTPPMPTLEN
ncbi:hypothetical protein BGZ63DRAFT_400770 [Mariannaea sp. PMI_226]|nr:hypothetical protein BGZ63DRAFT_400770 [Mariannaea sp. PMI_226]